MNDEKYLAALRTYWKQHSTFPFMARLCEVPGLSSTSSVFALVGRLTDAGYLQRQEGRIAPRRGSNPPRMSMGAVASQMASIRIMQGLHGPSQRICGCTHRPLDAYRGVCALEFDVHEAFRCCAAGGICRATKGGWAVAMTAAVFDRVIGRRASDS